MPLYVFACPACGVAFEVLLPSAERDAARRCLAPGCRELVVRHITSANWQFGTGPPMSSVASAIKRVKARGL